MKSRYLMSCAVAAVLSGAAYAEPQAAAGASPADAIPGEIIVTATRRNESIQKVPLTIQAFTGDTLSKLNVANFNDLIKFTPNVTFGNNGPGAGSIFLRGLSSGFAGSQSASTTGYFPNVALYLDDQSMQFPARNADIYVADMERVEVLEGPQGTLFGGGAEAGAVRYITNKPKLNVFEGHFEGSAGATRGGAPNGSFNATVNIPIISDKLAVRAVIYDDHHGGYIDNVPGTYTRTSHDPYANYLPNPTAANQSNGGQYNNTASVKKDFNPVDYIGGRIAVKWQVNDDWDVLVSEAYQKLDAEGTFSEEPYSPDNQKLGRLQTVTFTPSYNKDDFSNTAWTVNGKIGDFHLVYTGAYMVRHIETQQDYTNYSRRFGSYYQCVGSGTGIGNGVNGQPYCYDPYSYWHDQTRSTHMSHEVRLSSPVEKRLRFIVGGFYEKFRIYDNMDFDYKSTPTCDAALIAGGTGCLGLLQPVPGTTMNIPGTRGPKVAFGEDTQRGYDQYAGFASVDFDIFPNLTLSGGTRYYHYKEFETGSQYGMFPVSNCLNVLVCKTGVGGDMVNIDANNDHVVYHGFRSRGTLTWKPTNLLTIYGTFSQGFRPGGFNRTAKTVLPDQNGNNQYQIQNGYTPDKLTNWEVGIKADMLDHKLQVNLSGYYMVWNNIQFGFFDPGDGFGNTTFVVNGADYHIKGGEIQATYRPISGLSIQGSATYNDSKQVSSPCLVSTVPGSATLGQCITYRYSKGNKVPIQAPFGLIGSSLPFAPHFQGNARIRYDWAGPAELKYWVGAGVTYTGSTYNQPANFPAGVEGSTIFNSTLLRYRMPGYALADAQIGIRKDNWSASIFGDNIFNSHASTFTSSAQYIESRTVVRPTTYGVKFTFDF
jgi:outer membrane receptor protein involved in Fe transport